MLLASVPLVSSVSSFEIMVFIIGKVTVRWRFRLSLVPTGEAALLFEPVDDMMISVEIWFRKLRRLREVKIW